MDMPSCSKFPSTSATRQLRNLQLLSCRFSLLKLILKKKKAKEARATKWDTFSNLSFTSKLLLCYSLCCWNIRGRASTLVRRLRPWEALHSRRVLGNCTTLPNLSIKLEGTTFESTWMCQCDMMWIARNTSAMNSGTNLIKRFGWGLFIVSPGVEASFWVAQPTDLPTPGRKCARTPPKTRSVSVFLFLG